MRLHKPLPHLPYGFSELSEIDQHRVFLKRKNFDLFDIPMEQFTAEEWSFLREHGNWLEALDLGLISPITELQSNFIEVVSEIREPSTFAERLWIKYLDWDRRLEKPGAVRDVIRVNWIAKTRRIQHVRRIGRPHKIRHLNGDLPHGNDIP